MDVLHFNLMIYYYIWKTILNGDGTSIYGRILPFLLTFIVRIFYTFNNKIIS